MRTPHTVRVHAWLLTMSPDASVLTVGASTRNVSCVVVSNAKLKRNEGAFRFTSAAGLAIQFQVHAFLVKAPQECITATVQHALAGGCSISNVTVQAITSLWVG